MGDLEILSSEESPKIAGKSEARMQHRVVRMVALATRYDSNPLAMVELGVAALATARSIQRRREVLDKLPVTDVEAIRGTLASLSDLGQRPARAT
jgi:hypothetical protein